MRSRGSRLEAGVSTPLWQRLGRLYPSASAMLRSQNNLFIFNISEFRQPTPSHRTIMSVVMRIGYGIVVTAADCFAVPAVAAGRSFADVAGFPA